jgi:hypothetical protein
MDVGADVDVAKANNDAGQESGSGKGIAVVRMRVQRVLPDGSAEFTSAAESLTATGNEKTENVDVKKIPVQRFIMSNTGGVKWLTPARKPAKGGSQDDESFRQMLSSITDFVLPGKALKAGDTWDVMSSGVSVGEGESQLPLKATLVRTDAVAAGHKVAEISMTASMAPASASVSVMKSPMTASAGFAYDGKYYFSPELGCMIQSETSITVDMGILFGGLAGPEGQKTESEGQQPPAESPAQTDETAGASMKLRMSFKAELLPE